MILKCNITQANPEHEFNGFDLINKPRLYIDGNFSGSAIIEILSCLFINLNDINHTFTNIQDSTFTNIEIKDIGNGNYFQFDSKSKYKFRLKAGTGDINTNIILQFN